MGNSGQCQLSFRVSTPLKQVAILFLSVALTYYNRVHIFFWACHVTYVLIFALFDIEKVHALETFLV